MVLTESRPPDVISTERAPYVISTESASGEIPQRALARSWMVNPTIHPDSKPAIDPERDEICATIPSLGARTSRPAQSRRGLSGAILKTAELTECA